ncbi:MAG TPA: hypothetical protein VHX86_04690 [Tepidisphaeraceae bacterium]|jgi:hypothetical protein|nr:hypothetical protein [Tepidisphaeraceae bacterium]
MTGQRWVVAGLLVLGVAVFGIGINWGLPSHQIDPLLFGSGPDAATNSLNAYRLSGVGIDRLAGDWDESGNLAADVAEHPIADRSKPVTLLENRHGMTADELIRQGDLKMAALVAAADAADRAFTKVREADEGEAKTTDARNRALKTQHAVTEYVEKYNQRHFPGLADAIKQDDVSRARILRRYRLYSYQPDEMITFRALAMMHPGQMEFDPKLYQYGGLWIYPVGAILKAASLINYVTLSGDRAYYLDSPEAFGRFYILARAYSAAWGLVAMLAVFALVRRAAGGLLLPAAAAICFIFMPVVVDLAHEAKPHLAGTALLLLAILAAGKYAETGRWKWIIWTSIACGASAGMVLSSVVGLAILPVMSLIRRDGPGRLAAVCVVGILIAAAVYFAADPYVAIHLVGNREVLESNFANTRAMYTIGPMGTSIVNAARLVAAGMSLMLAIVGIIAAIALVLSRRRGLGWPLGLVAVIVLAQFSLYAWNKPGDYGRFALFADTALMLAAFVAVARFIRPTAARAIVAVIIVGCTGAHSVAYERGFMRDSLPDDSRMRAAAAMNVRLTDSPQTAILYLTNEPVPYCVPPFNLFRWRVVLLPPEGQIPAGSGAGTLVQVVNPVGLLDPTSTPLSWADKQFDVK